MNVYRMFLGVLLFLVSSWVSPYLADVIGIPQELSFLMIGGTLAFFGGIMFYSGVKQCRCSYQF